MNMKQKRTLKNRIVEYADGNDLTSAIPTADSFRSRVLPEETDEHVQQASVIIINYNGGADLIACLAALSVQNLLREVVIVDNASVDGSLETAMESFPEHTFIRSVVNLGFGGGANLGAQSASGQVLVFLNPDTIVAAGCIDELVVRLTEKAGVAGPLIITEGTTEPDYGATIDLMGLPRGITDDRIPLFIQGCCLAASRECFDSVGGFDEDYFLFVEDTEFAWQALRRGFEVQVVKTATAHHRGGASAIGGYLRQGVIETTSMRILLRERNTTAMLLACAPAQWFPMLLVTTFVRAFAFATLLVVNRRLKDVGRLIDGYFWNMKRLPVTMHRRFRPGTDSESSKRAWRRVIHGFFIWSVIRNRSAIRLVNVSGRPSKSSFN